jgi:hypothetical protein
MFVFRRTRIANPGDQPEARRYAVTVATQASAITGRQITAFETLFGGPAGAISWSTPVKDMADFGAMTEKLNGAPNLSESLAAASKLWATHGDDALYELVANAITSSDAELYVSTAATPQPGRIADAVVYGVQVQAYLQKAGFQSAFGTSPFGTFGEVGWLLAAGSMKEVDRFRTFTSSDAGFAQLLADSGPLFLPGSGVNRLVRRLD